MKIIQSFWSKPYQVNKVSDFKTVRTSWVESKYLLLSSVLSCVKLKEFNNDVELITDSLGYNLLIDELGLPYSSAHRGLDDLVGHKPSQLWSFGKMYSYSLQDKPFIHVDGDVFVWKEFPLRIKRADLVAQSLEIDRPVYKLILKEIFREFDYIPGGFSEKEPLVASNAGIMGGNKHKFFKNFFHLVSKFINNNSSKLNNVQAQHLNVVFEQYYFRILAAKEKIKIEHLFDEDCEDSQLLRFNEVPHSSWYIHPYASYKGNINYCRQIEGILSYEYPSIYKNALRFLNSRSYYIDYKPLQKYQLSTQSMRKFFDDKFKRNIKIWRSADQNSLFDLIFSLSKTSSINTSYDENNEVLVELAYVDPVTFKIKTIRLEGMEKMIIHFEKPTSINQFINEFEDSHLWSKVKANKIKKMILTNLTRCMFYFNAFEVQRS